MSELKTLLLTERITRLEQQLTEARAEIERLRKPVTVRCSYCGEIICTEAEWNDKVPDHMVSCPKNPARIFALENACLLAENKRLKAAISWALGESGIFRVREPDDGPYWWRIELRARAAGDKG